MNRVNFAAAVTVLITVVLLSPVRQALAGETKLEKPDLPKHVAAMRREQPRIQPITVRLTKYHAKPAFQMQLRKAISSHVFASVRSESNLMIEAYHEMPDSTVIWVIERWKDKQAMAKSDLNAQAVKIAQISKTALLTPAETILATDLEPLTKAGYRKVPKKTDKPMTAMLFVDSKSGTQDVFKARYHIAMPKFRGEPGVVTYQLSQQEGDPTKFITYEKFRNDGSLQEHLKFPPVKPILDYLHTSIKEPPFEKYLHKLTEFAPLRRE